MCDSEEDIITYEDKVFLLEMLNENPTINFFDTIRELESGHNFDALMVMLKNFSDPDNGEPPKFRYLGGRPVAKTEHWSEVKNLDELDFWKTMHMSRELFNHVVQLCEVTVKEAIDQGVNLIYSECNVSFVIAVCVWYLVNKNKSLAEMSDYFEISSQDLVEDTLIKGFHILARLKCSTIVWPTSKDLKQYSAHFQHCYNFENVVGVLGSYKYTSERGEDIFIHGIVIDGEFKTFDVVNTESLDSALIESRSVLSNLEKVPRGYSVVTSNIYRESTIENYNIIKPEVRKGSKMNELFKDLKEVVDGCLRHLTLTFPRLLEPHRYLPDAYTSAVILQNLINARHDFVPERT